MTIGTHDAVTAFGEHLAALASRPLPPEVAEHARLSLFNVLVTAVGGSRHPGVDAIAAVGARDGGTPVAAPPGRTGRLDAHHAALATGFAAHVDDFDDTHLATVIHPGAAALGVLVGLGGRGPAGDLALRAFAVGCEAQLRLGLAITPWHYDRGWHITGTCGPAGAAATAAILLGVPAGRWHAMLGHALHQPLGMREGFGTMTKAMHAGKAAANGLRAARLAAAGVPGPERVLPDGAFVAALSGDFADTELLGEPERWRLLENTFKPYPCGIVSHPGIEAGERLAGAVRGGEIEEAELRCHPLVVELTGNPQPRDGLEARFSTIHGVAAALLDGTVGLAQYEDERVRAADLVELRGRLRLVPDDDCPRDAAELTVRHADGRLLHEAVEHARGSLARPLGWDDLLAKAAPLVAGVLGDDAAPALAREVQALDARPSVAALLEAVAPAAPAAHRPGGAAPPDAAPGDGATAALAAFAAGATVPADVREAALAGAWSSVTAARGRARRPEVLAARDAAGEEQTPSRTASLGALAAILEGVDGSTAVVASAVLALAGRDAAGDGIAVGEELARRLEAALAPVAEVWLPEGGAALVGAAAGVSRALGGSPGEAARAIGIAATQCAGFRDVPEERCRALAGAKAAADAVEAALLAREGFTAPATALEGRRGFFALVLGGPPPGALLDGLGRTWSLPAAGGAARWPDDVAVGPALAPG
jgi:2-methylcitrate dehydratase PrpD